MNQYELLRAVADTCRDLVTDAESAIMTCTGYEDATLIGSMQTHQLIGLRRLMLPLAESLGAVSVAESIFDRYLCQLEAVKAESRHLLRG